MAQLDTQQPVKTFRGTWRYVLTHIDEIPATSEVELRVYDRKPTPEETPTMVLMKFWLEEDATDDPDELKVAEAELLEFKRNMNKPRQEAHARLLYPEAE